MKAGDEVYFENLPGVGVVACINGEKVHVNWDDGSYNMVSKQSLKLKNSKEEPKGHPNASILMEIAKEAAINKEYWKEFGYDSVNFGWQEFVSSHSLFCRVDSGLSIRRKPHTIRIGNYDVPEFLDTYVTHGGFASTLSIKFDNGDKAELMLKALQELLAVKK